MVKQKTKRVAKYSDKAKAEAHARRLRAQGHDNVRVRRDSTGHWIVELLFLGLALGIIGAALRPR